MPALLQRVSQAAVDVADEHVAEIGPGLLVFLGVSGAVLVVSQFTLYADTARGRRPGFTGAGAPDLAERLYLEFAGSIRGEGVADVQIGRFGAEMRVSLVNDGPFTIWLDTEAR